MKTTLKTLATTPASIPLVVNKVRPQGHIAVADNTNKNLRKWLTIALLVFTAYTVASATSATYSASAAQPGGYRCKVYSDGACEVISNTATLSSPGYFVLQYTFTSAQSNITFSALTASNVNYTLTSSVNGTTTGTINQATLGTVTLTGARTVGEVVTLSLEPTNLRQFKARGSADYLTDVPQWGTAVWTSMNQAFYGCSNLTISATDKPNLSAVTDMQQMFGNCYQLNGPANIGTWDVSHVTNMSQLFASSPLFNQDISNWKTGNVTLMSYMFYGASAFNQNLSPNETTGAWDVSQVTSMANMFNQAAAFNNGGGSGINNWKVGNVTDMFAIFKGTAFNQPIGSWDVSKVPSFVSMFQNAAAFNQDLSQWNVSNGTGFTYMFQNATSFNQNIGNWVFKQSQTIYDFLSGSGISCANYSATLAGWANHIANQPSGVNFNYIAGSKPQYGTDAVTARQTLINKGWNFTTSDAASGTACIPTPSITNTIANQAICDGQIISNLAITLSDADVNNVTLSATDTSGTINPTYTFGGSGANRTLSIAAVSGQVGATAVNVIATNSYGAKDTTTFLLELGNKGMQQSTLAGNGTSATTGDGGPAASAQLNYPIHVAVDAQENIYIREGGSLIRKIDATTGNISTLVTNAGGTYNNVVTDKLNNVYYINQNIIYKIPAGSTTPVAYAGATSGSEAADNTNVATTYISDLNYFHVTSNGDLIVVTNGGAKIRKISPGKIVTTIAGVGTLGTSGDGALATSAQIAASYGLTSDASGNIFFGEYKSNGSTVHRIRKIDAATGNISTVIGNGSSSSTTNNIAAADGRVDEIMGLDFDASGNLIIAPYNSNIRYIDSNNKVQAYSNAFLLSAFGVACSKSSSTVYRVTKNNGYLYKYTPTYTHCNAKPVIATVATQSTCDNVAKQVSLTVTDADNDVVTVTATSSNATLVPNANISYSNGTLTITPANGQVGESTITLTPNDGKANGTAVSFVLEVGNKTVTASTVSTFAGQNGVQGLQDGTGAGAQFKSILSVSMDQNGNMYLSDDAYSIRKITPAAEVSTIAGAANGYLDGPGNMAKFRYPQGIATDAGGNLYVADGNNNVIRKITPQGDVSTLAGSPSTLSGDVDGNGSNAKFYYPTGVAVDANGYKYVVDSYNNKIRKISPTGDVTTLAGAGESAYGYADGEGTNAKFANPTDLAIDAQGNIYVTDQYNNRIRKITPQGNVTTLAGSSSGFLDGNGTNAKFNTPTGIDIDSEGNLYVADQYNHRIRKITPDGVVSTVSGSTRGYQDGSLNEALFYYPSDLVVDPQGNIYVADNTQYIRKISAAGASYSPCNNKPVLSASGESNLNNDTLCLVASNTLLTQRALTATDADGSIASTVVISSNPSLVTVTNTGNNTNMVLSLTQQANQSGTATIKVVSTDNLGAKDSVSFVIKVNAVVIDSTAGTNVLCHGNSTGSLTVTPTGGIAPYSYQWTKGGAPTGSNSPSITGKSAGIYNVTVTDKLLCKANRNLVISQPTAPLNLAKDSTNITCYENNDGTAKVTPTGGTAPYTYAWNNGLTDVTASITGLGNLSYTVTVTDAKGCQATASFKIFEPGDIVIDTQPMGLNPVCEGKDTLLTVAATGGGLNYQWFIKNPLASSGTALVNDANHQGVNNDTLTFKPKVFNNTERYFVRVSQNATCFKESNLVQVVAEVCNIAPALSAVQNQGVCPSGTFAAQGITITDEDAATVQLTALSSNSVLVPVANVTFSGTGASRMVQVAAAGTDTGTAIISIIATDAFSATDTVRFTVRVLDTVAPVANIANLPILRATCQVLAPVAPQATDNCMGVITGITNTVFPITTQGTDTIVWTYTDAVGNSTVQLQQVIIADTINPTLIAHNNIQLALGNNGMATLSTAMVDSASFDNCAGAVLLSLSKTVFNCQEEGMQVVKLYATDAAGNTDSISVQVAISNPNFVLQATAQPDTVCAGAIVQLDVNITGTSYAWTGPNGYSSTTKNPSITNASVAQSGYYTISLTDANNCVGLDSVRVTVNPLPSIGILTVNTGCYNQTNASITFADTAKGNTYSWSNGATTASITGIGKGKYSLKLTNKYGCEVIGDSIAIVQPDSLQLSLSSSMVLDSFNVSSLTAADGSISSTVIGGVSPYTYVWNNAATTSTINNLTVGTYRLTVTDANTCATTATIVLKAPKPEPTGIPKLLFTTGLSPNGDGKNDFFVIDGVEKAPNTMLVILDQFGGIVFEGSNYRNTWDGRNKSGDTLPEGTYFYIFTSSDRAKITGYITLRRD